MQIEVLTERISNDNYSAILDYRTKRVIDIRHDCHILENLLSDGVSFDDVPGMIHLWEAIKERLNMPYGE